MAEKRSGKHRGGADGATAESAGVATEAAAASETATEAVDQAEAAEHLAAADAIEELQQQLEAKARQADENLGRLQRLAADFENYKRRVQREKEELSQYGAEQFITTILPVLDNLERALASFGDEQALRTGVELTARQLREALAKAGVLAIAAEGETFDPHLHMAVAVDAESEAAEDTIVAELQRGYKMGDRVLRPSMVKVAKK